MKRETAEWIAKAEADFRSAELEFRAQEPNLDATCFHAQQSAEKYLKAMLQEHRQPFPKTHDLELLLDLLLPIIPTLNGLRMAAQALTGHSVEFRYPGIWADDSTARRALDNSAIIREQVRNQLDQAQNAS